LGSRQFWAVPRIEGFKMPDLSEPTTDYLSPFPMAEKRAQHPDAEFLIHPECGCASAAMLNMAENPSCFPDTHVCSTEGMIRRVEQSPKQEFLIATETGIMHRMKKFNPAKKFVAVNDRAVCQFMKMITLDKLLRSLREEVFEVKVPKATADKARLAIQRMIEIC
jgi:quinolinate synthase